MSEKNHVDRPISRGLERLPDRAARVLSAEGLVREYQAGDLITERQDGDDRIRFIVSGEASLVLRDQDGERIVVDTLAPGDIFDQVGFFTGVPWRPDAELVAEKPCSVIEVSGEAFERALHDDPQFTVPLVKSLVRRIMRLNSTVLDGKLKRRTLQALISRPEHVLPGYVMGDTIRERFTDRIDELAKTDSPVLIIGENGVGKGDFARSLFRKSHHGKDVFLQTDLLTFHAQEGLEGLGHDTSEAEQELTFRQERLFFGSEEPGRGGATKETPGYFELSDGGTLLIRGAEQLTPQMQLNLLEALVTCTFRRQGGVRLRKAQVRLMATTSREASAISLERHPLLYALLEGSVVVPPLRGRRSEIPGLAKNYVRMYSRELGRQTVKVPDETLNALLSYRWPGNDLELASALERALQVSKGDTLTPQDVYLGLKRVEGKGKFNLLKWKPIRQALLSPLFPAVLQSAATPFFLIVLAFLFLGPADPMRNPAALFSWALGWPILIGGAFLWARFWCSLCPIGVLGNLAKKVVSLERPFPAFLKTHSDFLIAAAVLLVIWFETATDLRNSPFHLGMLLVVMLVSTIVVGIIYERESWCLYLCGLGGMIGVLSKASLIELRADRNVCIAQCASNECYQGTETEAGCPYGQAGPKLMSNRLCKLCASCLKNCPYAAVKLNLRVPGKELWETHNTNPGTAFLVIGLIGGLLCEMIMRSPLYADLADVLPGQPIVRFSIVFAGILAIVNGGLMAAAAISRLTYREPFVSNYSRFGLAMLPITLTSFLAFHIYYFIHVGVQLPTLLSQNFDFEVFRQLVITAPTAVTQTVQQALLWCGLGWSLLVIYRLGRDKMTRSSRAILGSLPHAVLAVILSGVVMRIMHGHFYG
jgi:polyferredoxin/CRP-like cAMP-binding protein